MSGASSSRRWRELEAASHLETTEERPEAGRPYRTRFLYWLVDMVESRCSVSERQSVLEEPGSSSDS